MIITHKIFTYLLLYILAVPYILKVTCPLCLKKHVYIVIYVLCSIRILSVIDPPGGVGDMDDHPSPKRAQNHAGGEKF